MHVNIYIYIYIHIHIVYVCVYIYIYIYERGYQLNFRSDISTLGSRALHGEDSVSPSGRYTVMFVHTLCYTI